MRHVNQNEGLLKEMDYGQDTISMEQQFIDYTKNVSAIIHSPDLNVDKFVEQTLRQGIFIMEQCKHSLQELDFYRQKYTRVRPTDVEMSATRGCKIGRCKCGQLMIEYRDRCCPKCSQFVDWSAPIEKPN